MNRVISLTGSIGLLFSAVLLGQDVMQYGVKHLKVLAEDDKVATNQSRAVVNGPVAVHDPLPGS